MADVQKEHGYVPISAEYLDALVRTRIRGRARQVLDFIIRKTWGYNKKSDRISNSQIVRATGLKPPQVRKEIKFLTDHNFVTQTGNDFVPTYTVQKDYDKWNLLPKKVTTPKVLPKKVQTVTQKGNSALPKKVSTIINSTDNVQKKERVSRKRDTISPIYERFLNWWCEEYRDRFGRPYKVESKDRGLIKSIFEAFEHDYDFICQLAVELLETDDEWILAVGQTIAILSSQANRLAQQVSRGYQPQRAETPEERYVRELKEEYERTGHPAPVDPE